MCRTRLISLLCSYVHDSCNRSQPSCSRRCCRLGRVAPYGQSRMPSRAARCSRDIATVESMRSVDESSRAAWAVCATCEVNSLVPRTNCLILYGKFSKPTYILVLHTCFYRSSSWFFTHASTAPVLGSCLLVCLGSGASSRRWRSWRKRNLPCPASCVPALRL